MEPFLYGKMESTDGIPSFDADAVAQWKVNKGKTQMKRGVYRKVQPTQQKTKKL